MTSLAPVPLRTTPRRLPQTPVRSPSILFSPALARRGPKTSPRPGAASSSPRCRSVPGVTAARPPKLLPVLVDPLVRHWGGQGTRLPPSPVAPHGDISPPSSNIGDFFPPLSRIFWFPAPLASPPAPCHPRVTPGAVSPHLSPARTGQPACRVSPSPSPFLRRFHQKRAAFCGAERGHGPGFGTPQQP